jgi:hypothetical protein
MDNASDLKKSKYNCPEFFKNYKCKHFVGIAIRLKYFKPPSSAKTVPIVEERKRVRSARTKPAFSVQ